MTDEYGFIISFRPGKTKGIIERLEKENDEMTGTIRQIKRSIEDIGCTYKDHDIMGDGYSVKVKLSERLKKLEFLIGGIMSELGLEEFNTPPKSGVRKITKKRASDG